MWGRSWQTRRQSLPNAPGTRAVAAYGADVLEAGSDLVVASVGALSDPALAGQLSDAARRGGSQLVVPSGAIGGIDILAAARLSALTSVRYTGTKPPMAWSGTPAEEQVDLSALEGPTVIFEGSARQAAQSYPKNANVAATLALAGIGMDPHHGHAGCGIRARPRTCTRSAFRHRRSRRMSASSASHRRTTRKRRRPRLSASPARC